MFGSEKHSEPSQTSKIGLIAKTVNSFHPLTEKRFKSLFTWK